MEIRTFVVSPIGSNCYVLSDSLSPGAQAVVIDPGDTALDAVFEYIDSHQLKVTAVWNTHGHFDHVMGVDLVRARYGVPALLHEADVPLWDSLQEVTRQWLRRDVTALNPPDRIWQDGDVVTVGSLKFTIMHTPGHSPGSICLVGDKAAFTGDTLFENSIGRTDFPLSSPADMDNSLRRLLTLPDDVAIFPGHGRSSSLAKERTVNPFLRDLT